ncbi:MAG: hypothetical protein KC501_41555 [Myxococcales bacterium]|nr:hypothetical protein [Myxococcales bacterium]
MACLAAISATTACFDPDPVPADDSGTTGPGATDDTMPSTSGMVADGSGSSSGGVDGSSGDTSTADPCDEVTCDPNATCDGSSGEAVCTCNPGWEGDGSRCTNIDECADDPCDPNATCMDEPGSFTCTCNPGFTGDGLSCADEDECALGTDDCGPNQLCLNEASGFSCACRPGDGGVPCSPGTILVYDDTNSPGNANLAATSLGYTVNLTASRADFQAAFDAGGYDLIIYDAPGIGVDSADQTRLSNWISGGGRLVFGAYNLNSFAPMQAALGVSVVTYGSPRPVYDAAGAVLSLYDQLESITSPMTTTQDAGDNGDELSLTGPGFVLARLDGPAGPGAIVLTNEHRVIVNGFLPYDIGTADVDMDGTADMVEMYRNQIGLLMRPRVLLYGEAGSDGPQAAARRIGWTSIPMTTGPTFTTAYDAALYDVVVIDVPTGSLPTGVRTRLVSGLAASDRIVLSWWDLESDGALQAALGIGAMSIGMPQDVYDDPSGVVDFFHVFQDVPDPLVPVLDAPGNGFSCTPSGEGSVEAHFESAMGPGAICVTNGGRVIVNGFLPYDLGDADADGDMIRDVEELYENQYYRLMTP